MQYDNKALLFTAIFFTVLLFLSLVLGFVTPLPLPAEQGILINFGEDETGFGANEPAPSEQIVEEIAESSETVSESSEEVQHMTQDFEEAPAVQATSKKPDNKKDKESEKKPEEKVEERKPVVNSRALYRGRNTNSSSNSSEGIAGGAGNQGKENGDENAANYSLGNGGGNGISFSLKGRTSVRLPVPDYKIQEQGKVVVEVTVDRNGKVIHAKPGAKGSTTGNSELLKIAKRAALTSRFNSKGDAPAQQVGYITYVFSLK